MEQKTGGKKWLIINFFLAANSSFYADSWIILYYFSQGNNTVNAAQEHTQMTQMILQNIPATENTLMVHLWVWIVDGKEEVTLSASSWQEYVLYLNGVA